MLKLKGKHMPLYLYALRLTCISPQTSMTLLCTYGLRVINALEIPCCWWWWSDIHCVWKKETKMLFIIYSTKLRRFWRNLVCCFPNKFAAKTYKNFPPHLNNVSTLWNLECLSGTCCQWIVKETNHTSYPTLTVASKLARFESIWLHRVQNTATEGAKTRITDLDLITMLVTNGCLWRAELIFIQNYWCQEFEFLISTNEFLISGIGVVDISNSNCWQQKYELLISRICTHSWYQEMDLLISTIVFKKEIELLISVMQRCSNCNSWYQQCQLFISRIRILDIKNSHCWYQQMNSWYQQCILDISIWILDSSK